MCENLFHHSIQTDKKMAPVLCNSITTKKNFLALGLTVTSVLSLIAFATAAVMGMIIYANTGNLAQNYNQYNNNNNNNYYNNNNNYNWYYNGNKYNQNQGGNDDRKMYGLLASVSSSSIIFVSIYTACLATVMAIYGCLRVVGFINLNGSYIKPSFSDGQSNVDKKHFGVFLGAFAILANICLIVSVILGEFQIGGVEERRVEGVGGVFAVERTAAVLAAIFVSLSVTYFIYSLVLFAYKDQIMEEVEETSSKNTYKSPEPASVLA